MLLILLAKEGRSMDAIRERYDGLVCSAARRLTGAEHRSFIAEATLTRCDGKAVSESVGPCGVRR